MELRRAALWLTLLLALPAAGEQKIVPLPASGLVKADLGMTLYEVLGCTPPLCATVDTSGVTVDEQANGRDYLIAGLPDVAAGEGLYYQLTWSYAGTLYDLSWPTGTRTPLETSAGVSYQVPEAAILAAGDTLPMPKVDLAGLPADPTGAAVLFVLEDLGDAVVLSAAGEVVNISADTDGTWSATVRYPWAAGETSALDGEYTGRFRVTYSGGGVQTFPPAPGALEVRVHP